jgi:hypothetical protein
MASTTPFGESENVLVLLAERFLQRSQETQPVDWQWSDPEEGPRALRELRARGQHLVLILQSWRRAAEFEGFTPSS